MMKKSLLFLSTALAVLSCTYEAKAMEDKLLKEVGNFVKDPAFPPCIPALTPTNMDSGIQDIREVLGHKGKDLVQDLMMMNKMLGGHDYTSTRERVTLIWDMVGRTSNTLYNEIGLVRFSFLQPPIGTIRQDILSLEKRLVPAPSGVIGHDLDKILNLATDKPDLPLFSIIQMLCNQLSPGFKIDDSIRLLWGCLVKSPDKTLLEVVQTIRDLVNPAGMPLYEGVQMMRERFTRDPTKPLMDVAIEVQSRIDTTIPLEDGMSALQSIMTYNTTETLMNGLLRFRNQIHPGKIIEEGLQMTMECLTNRTGISLIRIADDLCDKINPGATLEQSIQDMGELLTDNKTTSLLGTTQVLHDHFTDDKTIPLIKAAIEVHALVSDDKKKSILGTLVTLCNWLDPGVSLEKSIKDIRVLTTSNNISLLEAINRVRHQVDGAKSNNLLEGVDDIRHHLVRNPLEAKNLKRDLLKVIQPMLMPTSIQTGILEEDINHLRSRIIHEFKKENLLEDIGIIHELLNDNKGEKEKDLSLEELIMGSSTSIEGSIMEKINPRPIIHKKGLTSNGFKITAFAESHSINSRLSTFLSIFNQDPGKTGFIKIPVGTYHSLSELLESMQP